MLCVGGSVNGMGNLRSEVVALEGVTAWLGTLKALHALPSSQ